MIGTEVKPDFNYVNAYIRHKTEVDNILAKLKGFGVTDYILISNEGVPLSGSIVNKHMHEETLAIMTATMYGAAATANGELRKGSPNYVSLGSEDAISIITKVGKGHILLVSGKPDLEAQIKNIHEVVQEVAAKLV